MAKPYEKLNDPHGPAKEKIAKPSRERRAHSARAPPPPDERRAFAQGQRYISYDELRLLYGIRYSRKQLKRMCDAGQFPQPVKLGIKRIAFVRTEIEAWADAREAERAAS
jgi:prophage regulatory protein